MYAASSSLSFHFLFKLFSLGLNSLFSFDRFLLTFFCFFFFFFFLSSDDDEEDEEEELEESELEEELELEEEDLFFLFFLFKEFERACLRFRPSLEVKRLSRSREVCLEGSRLISL